MIVAARIRRVADFDDFLSPWKRLAGQSLAPAGLNSPEMILPLLKNLRGAELAVVTQGADLLFALPIQNRKFPFGMSSNWITPLTIMGVPHLDRDMPAATLTAFVNSLSQPMLLRSIDAKGEFWNQLKTGNMRLAVLQKWQRAALRPVGTFADWLDTNFDRKRRKEYRRLSNRISELGHLESISIQPADDSRPWVNDLLALEAAGWKGKRGTALATSDSMQSALMESCQLLGAAGKLRFWKLMLDGKPVAIMHAIVEGDKAWLGKIAYDESYAKYSPGVLLILYATEKLFAESNIKLVDSCAIPGHPMIENIWRDRVEMADVVIAPKSVSATRFALAVLAEKLRRLARGAARDAYYYIKGKKRS